MAENKEAPAKPNVEKETKEKSVRTTGNWLEEYIKYTSSQESPEIFHLWVGITILAGALKRNVWLDRGGYFKLYPNLYTIIVSPTGTCRKSTAIRIGTDVLKKVDDMDILHGKMTPEGFIRELSRGELDKKTDGDKTKFVEKCVAFVQSSELKSLIGSASYGDSLVTLLTDLYECHDIWEYTTKTFGRVSLNNIYINFLGGSTPEWLAKGFDMDVFGGGFMGRIVFVFQNKGRKEAWPEKTPEQIAMESLLTMDLQHIARLNGNFKVTKNAYDYFKQWYDAYTPNLASKMAGYYERKHDHLLKLAMILSICEDDELVIKESHLKAGLLLLEQVEKLMPQAFAYVGATNEARIAQHIIELIVSKGGLATHKTCFSGVREQIKNKREFESVIETLIEAGIIFAAMRDKIVYYVLTDEYAHQLGAKKRKEKKKDGTS